jgi:hypothetical protein
VALADGSTSFRSALGKRPDGATHGCPSSTDQTSTPLVALELAQPLQHVVEMNRSLSIGSLVRVLHRNRPEAERPAQRLMHRLARELYQNELQSLAEARREVRRLGGEPPGVAMSDVVQHASHVVRVLPKLFEERGIVDGGLVGPIASLLLGALRRLGVDLVLGHERSYRLTLLGQRHGIDLVFELEQLAIQMHDAPLTEWCRGWLERRVPLVTAVERQLQWFVAHPERALEVA